MKLIAKNRSALKQIASYSLLASVVALHGCTQTETPATQPVAKKTTAQQQGSLDNRNDGSSTNPRLPSQFPNANPSDNGGTREPFSTPPPISPVILPPVVTPVLQPPVVTTPNTNPPVVINPGRGEIKTRAPYSPVPAGYSATQMTQWVNAHQAKVGQGFKYVFITPEVAANKDTANTLRVAVAKAWNHVSWLPELDIPEDVSDGAGLVFALNVQKLWGADATTNWQYIANCSPKANIQVSPAPRGNCTTFDGNQPVAAERFVYNAIHGGPYANIHKTPPNYGNFTRKYSLGRIFAVSTQKDAIVCGPRITAFRLAFPGVPRNEVPQYSTVQEAVKLMQEGKGILYSYTSDEFNGRDGGDIRYQIAPSGDDQRSTGSLNAGPNDRGTAVASEWWMQLPNGFMYFSIHGEGAQERGKGEFPFAIDPANWKQGAALATGRSCITCHIKGNQAALSDPEVQGKPGWTSNADLLVLNDYSGQRFSTAMEAITHAMSDDQGPLNEKIISGGIEPIKESLVLIEGPYNGRNFTCESFCRDRNGNGKFGKNRKKMCETMPAR